MAVQLNHTIVIARDRDASAAFLAEMLGLPAPVVVGPFAVVQVGETSLDFMDVRDYLNVRKDGGPVEVASQHYAFLVTEKEFDDIFERIRGRGLAYWADPSQQERGQINTWDGGRGIYFEDPSGHLLEVLTRPYGSGGTTASRPHPLATQSA
jgi:catechol 2,3-dioxygenase-like lactoylglutathione lyase family enzyme